MGSSAYWPRELAIRVVKDSFELPQIDASHECEDSVAEAEW